MSTNTASEIDALSAVFSALSDPTRRAMLTRLSQGDASVNELAVPFKMSLPAVSKHIKVLEKAGLLTKTISAQQRTCKIHGAQLKQAVDWIDQLTINKIAVQAINASTRAKKDDKNQVKTEKTSPKPKVPKKPKKDTTTLEKTHDNDPTDHCEIQQQIGFDF